jgi:hypothetical protein
MEYYSAIQKNETLLFAAMWLELEIFMLSEISQEQKDNYHIALFVCGSKKVDLLEAESRMVIA